MNKTMNPHTRTLTIAALALALSFSAGRARAHAEIVRPTHEIFQEFSGGGRLEDVFFVCNGSYSVRLELRHEGWQTQEYLVVGDRSLPILSTYNKDVPEKFIGDRAGEFDLFFSEESLVLNFGTHSDRFLCRGHRDNK